MNEAIMTSEFIFRKRRISYLAHKYNSPEKPNIIIAHANGYSAYTYRTYLENLSPNFNVYAMDFWGHGKSEGSLEEDGYKGWLLFRDQIIAFIESQNLSPVTAIGHSLGGGSSLLAASLRPQLFHKIIALDPVVLKLAYVLYGKVFQTPLAKGAMKRRTRFKSREIVRKAYRKSPAFRDWDAGIFEDYLASAFTATPEGDVSLALDPRIEAKIFNSVSFRNILFRLRNIRPEVHILTPDHSNVCPRSTARRIIAGNPLSTYETFPGITHFFPFEKPDWTMEQINRFL